MKKFIILFFICFVQSIFSQTVKKDYKTEIPPNELGHISEVIKYPDNHIYNTAAVDIKPQFPEGNEFLSAFIQQNYKSPKENLKGRVYATFIIEKDGSLSDIKIIRDLGFGTKEEAIRVLKLSPKWIPGKLNEKEVRVLYAIPMIVN